MGTGCGMNTPNIVKLLGSAVVVSWGLSASVITGVAAPAASAASCPDVEVVFARGTGEEPGAGPVGNAFADGLRSDASERSVDVYAVDYPATDQWATGIEGVRDAGLHVVSMAENCPNTEMVLGGYSQGAAVMGFVTSPAVPDGIDPDAAPRPLDPEVANHVSSVVLFGTPNERAMHFLGQPPVAIGPIYQAKTIELCVPEDAVCSDGLNFGAHNSDSYGDMINQGVDFAVDRLKGGSGGSGEPGPSSASGGFGS